MKRRLRRVMAADGRILIAAMDHPSFRDSPHEGLAAYGRTCEILRASGADAFLAPIGSIKRFADAFGPAPIIASVDTSPPIVERAVERALAVGADAVKCMVYPFSGDDSIGRAQRIAADADRLGVPFLAEAIPGGFSRGDLRTPDAIAAGARIVAETGADLIKTFYTGDPDSMRRVVEYAAVPVVILGGSRRDDLRGLLQSVYDAVVLAGCVGAAIGTNIWDAPDPAAVTRALWHVIHRQATVEEALELGADARAGRSTTAQAEGAAQSRS